MKKKKTKWNKTKNEKKTKTKNIIKTKQQNLWIKKNLNYLENLIQHALQAPKSTHGDSFKRFFEDYNFAWWNIWVSIILLYALRSLLM
jgi:hypothetical protein